MSTSDEEHFTLFWGGPFSQWYFSRFNLEGITFTHAEQYMMYKKAEMFEDYQTQQAILSATHPRKQKALGRQVRGFDNTTWLKHAYNIVYDGNYAKFTQNETLKKVLLETHETTLVEASPYDTLWGIGLRQSDLGAYDRRLWRGHNWLGRVLTQLRDDLLHQQHITDLVENY